VAARCWAAMMVVHGILHDWVAVHHMATAVHRDDADHHGGGLVAGCYRDQRLARQGVHLRGHRRECRHADALG